MFTPILVLIVLFQGHLHVQTFEYQSGHDCGDALWKIQHAPHAALLAAYCALPGRAA